MSKLFLLKSPKKRKEVGDVVVVLDKITAIRMAKDHEYILFVDTVDAEVVARFDEENDARQELKRLAIALGDDGSIANDYVIFNKPDKKKEMDSFFEELKKKISVD